MEGTQKAAVPAWPGPIAAITLFVRDLERAREYYRSTFGLPVVFQDKDSAVFKFGDTVVNLLTEDAAVELVAPAGVAGAATEPRSVYTVHVDDVDALCADLVGRGVKLLNGPMDRPWGLRTASFRDPDGHTWEIAK